MEHYSRKSIYDNLQKYDVLANKEEFIEVTEWHNGEGWDIVINEQPISLTRGQLEAIDFLTKSLDYKDE